MLYGRADWLLLGVVILCAAPAAAQEDTPGPPGPYIVDVRGAFSALSADRELAALLPEGVRAPSRGVGIELGAHVYPLSIGPARIGFGASVLRASSTRSPLEGQAATGSTAAVRALPGMSVTFITVAPQLSLNFGSDSGWSYLSAGLGRSRIRSEYLPAPGAPPTDTTTGTGTTGGTSSSSTTITQTVVPSGGLTTFNIGGGARWFARQHLAFTFDVRFHRLPAGSLGDATATTLIVAGAGVSIR